VLQTVEGAMRRALQPGVQLIGRLKYSRKFLLIGLVLIAPLVWVVFAYLGVQRRDTAFALKERVGAVYLRPATQLLQRMIAARSAAVDLAAGMGSQDDVDQARAGVQAAIAAVDAVHGAGATLGLTSQWAGLKRQIEGVLAQPLGSPAKAFSDYSGLTTAIESLIANDGNNSNMILDPDSDAYYVMDATLNRLTSLMDSAGQAGDMQIMVTVGKGANLSTLLSLEDLRSTILATLANSDPDYASAIHNTHYAGMAGQLRGPLARFDHQLKALTDQLSNAVLGTIDGSTSSQLATAVQARAMELDRATLPVINHLLAVRIAGFDANSKQTEMIALLGVLLAVYLFAAFYLSVRRSQTAILDGLQALRETGTDPLAEGLDAMATGDLTRRVDPNSPPIEQSTSDELGAVAHSVNEIREGVLRSIGSFNAMVEQLRRMLGEVSTSAESVTAASQEMSATSAQAGRATGEIARAVSDVAGGAERQVAMVDAARQAAEAVARAVAESAETAKRTAEAAQEARQNVVEGVSAAVQANDTMQAVRDSSAAVTSAIGELAAKSGQIGAIVETITGIAEQTNLLALNAAIEAARAGEQGRGFAVVAEEVRKLAEESRNAAAEISELIGSIQLETTKTVDVVQHGAKRTDEGAQVVERTRAAFESIGASVDDMAARIEQIAAVAQSIAESASAMEASLDEVAAVAQESSASTEEVSASAQETSASTEQIAASAEDLAGTAGKLAELVARFRIGG
jgi:methyl-accepting chemotaxis protein